MQRNGREKIFHDQRGIRKRYVVSAVSLFGCLIVGVFSVTAVSILRTPALPPLPVSSGVSAESTVSETVPQPVSLVTPPIAAWQRLLTTSTVERNPAQLSEVFGFFVNWDDDSLASLKAHAAVLDGLIPEWLHLASGTGEVVLDDPARAQETREFLEAQDYALPIYPLINNYNPRTDGWDSESLVAMLSSPDARHTLIATLLDYATAQHAAGITIDFEAVPDTSQAALVLFMGELSSAFHEKDLKVMLCLPLVDDSFDIATLAEASDHLILMAYDEHVPSDSVAGPIASMGWYVNGIAERFRTLSPEKYIVALGNYGYDWPADGSPGRSLTFQEAVRIADRANRAVTLESASLNSTFSYSGESGIAHQVWMLDALSVFNQVTSAEKLGGTGRYALWRLGSEDPTLWNLFQRPQVRGRAAAEKLKTIRFSYEVSHEGAGEILQLAEAPRAGSRDITYDEATGLVIAESLTDFPRPYVLKRWGGNDSKKIALTFDDGPDATYTPEILEILKQYDVPATFFVVGLNASLNPEILKTILRQGSEIGNHTYTHPDISVITQKQFRLELDTTERVIEGVLGRKALLFRPPYIEDTEPENAEEVGPLILTHDLGYYTVGLHIDSNDWRQPRARMIADSVLDQARAGAGNIVLLHDAGGRREQTVAALPLIIEGLQADGFEIVRVSELMGLTSAEVMPLVTADERAMSHINGLTFHFVSAFNVFMRMMFGIGIILGIGRFLILGSLGFGNTLRARFIRRRLERREQQYHPTVGVIIPAHNEAGVIVRTVRAVLASDYPVSKVIVIDDGSTDQTVAVIRAHFPDDSEISVISQVHGGKSAALNRGIA
ncbi:MAG: polysaccharide deacetylase family protein, partial [Candidatus Moraniibacteriota bacterium]